MINEMYEVVKVSGAVIWRGPHLLLARRGHPDKHAGRWELPGGKLEPGESAQACIEREIREELGLTVKAGSVLEVSRIKLGEKELELIAVECEVISGVMSPTVHDALQWVTPFEALQTDLLEADVPILRALSRLHPAV